MENKTTPETPNPISTIATLCYIAIIAYGIYILMSY